MKKAVYDKDLAQRIYDEFPGDIDSKAAALARIYGIAEEVKPYLGQGAYRSNGDMVSLVERLMEEKEKNALALREQSLETVVNNKETSKANISKSAVIYEIAKDNGITALRGIAKFARYAAYGALPTKYQNIIADNNGLGLKDRLKYTYANAATEAFAGICLMAYGVGVNNGFLAFGGTGLIVWQFGRDIIVRENATGSGSFFLTAPYYLARIPYLAVKSISSWFKRLYDEKKHELEGKALELETGDLPQLPSTKEKKQ